MRIPTKGLNPVLNTVLTGVLVAGIAGCAPATDQFGKAPGSEHYQRIDLVERLIEQNRFAEAAEVLRQTASVAPTRVQRTDSLVKLGELQLRTGDLAAAEAAFREVLLVRPRNTDALVGVGRIRALNDDLSGAESFLRDAIALEDTRAYSPLGVVLDLQGKHIAAQKIYAQGLEALPKDRELVANLSLSYALSGSYDQAINLADPLARLLVPARYKRNYVLILALAGRAADAQRVAKELELSRGDVERVFDIASKLRSNTAAGRLSILREFTV